MDTSLSIHSPITPPISSPTAPKSPSAMNSRISSFAPSVIRSSRQKTLQARDPHQILASSSSSISKYKELRPCIDNLCKIAKISVEVQQALILIYDKIETEFRKIEHSDSTQAWVQRADLLDAIDVIVEATKGSETSKCAPLEPRTRLDTKPIGAQDTLLVPYGNVEDVNKRIGTCRAQIFGSPAAFKEGVGSEYLEVERSGFAKSVAILTNPTSKLQKFREVLEKIFRKLTSLGGNKMRKQLKAGDSGLTKITKFSQSVAIGSSELVKAGDVAKPFYRGPKFLFGKTLHDYAKTDINTWFQRDLTPGARSEYLVRAASMEATFATEYATLTEVSQVAIANSDSRVRTQTLEAGSFGKEQKITGKVLSDDQAAQAHSTGDNPAYYSDTYAFTTKTLLGRAPSDDMGIKPEFTARAASLVDTLTADSSIILEAQHELLGSIWRSFDQQGATQVVQRLAPADVHNYVAPVGGTPLSHKRACELLKQRAEKLEAEGIPGQANEVKRLNDLLAVFARQEVLLQRPSQTTIDIYGTNQSVSTPAIANQSSILSQNDRKIMLFEHNDGSFSLHVFIGATGVNNVDVDQRSREMKAGDRQGDMQFGEDVTKARNGFAQTSDTTTADSHRKLKAGEYTGGFPINGSTVVSYYLPTDFRPLPAITQAKESLLYAEGEGTREVEIKCSMGDPLLVKTEIFYTQVLERCIPNLFQPGADRDIQIAIAGWQKDLTEVGYSAGDTKVMLELQNLINKTPKSSDDQAILGKLQRTVEARSATYSEDKTIVSATADLIASSGPPHSVAIGLDLDRQIASAVIAADSLPK